MTTFTILVHGQPARCYCAAEFPDTLSIDVQRFVDAVPQLKVGETFYLGMWLVKLMRTESGLEIHEYDYSSDQFFPELDYSMRLWQEQVQIINSQALTWFSIASEKRIFFSPSVLEASTNSVIEGVRDDPESTGDSGWVIYTAKDRAKDLPFEAAPFSVFLSKYDLNILRFLGLPPGWMFNVDPAGDSHVWQEPKDHYH